MLSFLTALGSLLYLFSSVCSYGSSREHVLFLSEFVSKHSEIGGCRYTLVHVMLNVCLAVNRSKTGLYISRSHKACEEASSVLWSCGHLTGCLESSVSCLGKFSLVLESRVRKGKLPWSTLWNFIDLLLAWVLAIEYLKDKVWNV